MNPLRWRGLHPFELVALAFFVSVAVTLRLRGFALDAASALYIAKVVGGQLPSLLALGFGLQLVGALTRRAARVWLRSAFSPPSLLLLLRSWFALALVTYAYTFLKLSVPVIRTRIFDAGLEQLDRLVHFGLAPTVFAAELARGTLLAPWLDGYYMFWLTSVLVVQSTLFWSADFGRRRNFLLACALLWSAGGWLYVALPALGPCYATPEVYAAIRTETPQAANLQVQLGRNYRAVVASRDGSRREIQPLFAIAAMPSLHVGGHWLFALWARRHARRLFLPFAIATGLTFFGSLVTGWHWAVDGYAGMLLAWGAVALADRWDPVPSETVEPQAGSSAA